MVPLSRFLAASAYAGAAFLFGLALGERGELGFVQYLFAATIPLSAAIIAFFARSGRAETLFTGAAMLAGLLLGQQQFARAWRDCSAHANVVRDAILTHYARSGDYPATLEELPLRELPCRCGLRKTILHYHANERGFRLWLTNDFERYVATERTPFVIATGTASAPPRTTPRSTR
ncbi:MAG: hypothetical protein JO197_04720 [Acidobacteria bacterium]|nr:hypothetical protein [Acidobacteriota bacterium]MBV9475242.1 hypothetical protein [Acidobacteriota bacterium]